ncbi:hypothetical protein GCM10007973_17500 [Polymorphobacter multimanifer]|uniref:Uncharacterized protein n=1 Tax=Polymorphobacter multimanifer TaxID=1070431 RepID=A0A841L3F0_9SPHN|nr:hypothetical protein [Polymorphobacter multimanifer]MBB6227197.1 hypothetical protein [Polymorphobacter multimanifer]GGI81546.1 hypothetical protein GCM10007973_17500 [Polymorphobacter multimanifer]
MDTPFDRGEVDRASLEATERLRQRLATERGSRSAGGERSRAPLPWLVAGGLLLFSAGMIANPWFEDKVRTRLPFADDRPSVIAAAELATLARRMEVLEARKEETPAPDERLARTEARVETSTDLLAREADRIDRLTAEVAGLAAKLEADEARGESALVNAEAASGRVQAMLTVMLARRALVEGRPLGAVEAPLRSAFETRYPGEVRAVAALGNAPVTLAQLQRELSALSATTGPAASGQSWWNVFSQRVSKLVRPAGADAGPPPRTAAERLLANGNVEGAALQLRRLPNPRPPAIDRWLAAATRLVAGQEALAALEVAALIPPPAEPKEGAVTRLGEERPGEKRPAERTAA